MRLSALLCVLSLGLVTALPASADVAPSEPVEAEAPVKALEPASDFTLKTLAGENYALSDSLGKEVVVISFFATWCGPCLKEMPHLAQMQEELRDKGVRVLWISVDDAKDEAKVNGIAKRFKLPADQVLLDFERKVVSAYHKRGVPPFTVIIDKNQMKVLEKLGYTEGDEKKIHEKVVAAL